MEAMGFDRIAVLGPDDFLLYRTSTGIPYFKHSTDNPGTVQAETCSTGTDAEGQCTITVNSASVDDVTARRATESALKVSEERYELAVAATNEGIYDVNLETFRVLLARAEKAAAAKTEATAEPADMQ